MLKKSRIAVLILLFVAIIFGYTFQLMQYQIVQGDSLREENSKSTVGTMEIVAPRGDILDRYGRVLATSKIGYAVLIQKAYFPSDKTQQDDELIRLMKILTDANETWVDELPITKTAPYKWDGTDTKKKAVIDLLNGAKKKDQTKLTMDASADEAIKELKTYYKQTTHSEVEQRNIIGIRYTMVVKGYSTKRVYTFSESVGTDTITKIQERSATLPGAVVQQIPVRTYPDGTIAPHIVGMTGRINAKELAANSKEGYTAEDLIGKFGVEKSMEKYLRGINGVETVEQNSAGVVTNTSITTQPQPGANVVLTIDKDLQTTLQDQLPKIINDIKQAAVTQHTAGANARGAAACVVNVKTGEVMAMATYPSYDLNQYSDNYTALSKDPLTPLLNRGIQGAYRPGSTFKPVVAVSGLMNNKITASTTWSLPATITIGSGATAWKGQDDEGRSRVCNVEQAISVSSNIFFYTLGRMLGIDAIAKTADAFGIGKKTNIELPSESAGVMSTKQYKKDKFSEDWYEADTCQSSIGQMYTSLTPLQLANYVATLVKSGKEYQVHIVRKVNTYDNQKTLVDNTTPQVISDAKIPQQVTDVVKKGMLAVTETGTASSIFSSFKMQVGGKTGTAEIIKLTAYNGVFICFAPFDDPEIAIATVVEYGHNGYQTAPAAKVAMQQYFGLNDAGDPLPSNDPLSSYSGLIQ